MVEGGSSIREAARRFAVSASAAIKLMQRVRETGSAVPAQVGGHRPAALARIVETTPDITAFPPRGVAPSGRFPWLRARGCVSRGRPAGVEASRGLHASVMPGHVLGLILPDGEGVTLPSAASVG